MGGDGSVETKPVLGLESCVQQAFSSQPFHYTLICFPAKEVGNKGSKKIQSGNEEKKAKGQLKTWIFEKSERTELAIFFLFFRLFKGVRLKGVLCHSLNNP